MLFIISSRQFDLRNPEMCKGDHPRNVLVNLNDHIGPHAEAKCLTMSPLRPELLAVGANDPYVRVYDRRMLHCRGVVFPHDMPSRFVFLIEMDGFAAMSISVTVQQLLLHLLLITVAYMQFLLAVVLLSYYI